MNTRRLPASDDAADRENTRRFNATLEREASKIERRHAAKCARARAREKRKKQTARTAAKPVPIKASADHVAFICNEIAEWRGIQTTALVDACRAKFPDPGLTPHWWASVICKRFPRDIYGTPTAACKYRDRIMAERDTFANVLRERIPLANLFIRVQRLAALFDHCAEIVPPQEWKDGHGKAITVGGKMPRDVRACVQILELIRREVGDDKITAPPQNIQSVEVKVTSTPLGPDGKPTWEIIGNNSKPQGTI